jgi:NhaA family Na+:H+ antiporter
MSDPDPGSDRRERDARTPGALLRPLQEFLTTTGAGATLLLIATLVALAWANSPWQDGYERLWHLSLGSGSLRLDLRGWVSDALMTLFFLVVGLEIKRELLEGELRDRRAAALPVIAALGGMVVPALLYLALTAAGGGAHGWAIPMATDIAFALGVLTLAARHAPPGLKPFLLTLAIVDDIGAIVVIALFYSGGLAWWWLAGALATVVAIVALRRVRAPGIVPLLGAVLWLCTFESGVHPTIAGVALGLLTPAVPPPGAEDGAATPLARLEHLLLPWTSFVIVPLFALANAGVVLSAGALREAATSAVTLGVVVGLVVGKMAGITGASALAVRLRVARLPADVRWPHLVGAAAVAGVGFTVSLFVTELAFGEAGLAAEAKVGILAGSVLAAGIGSLLLRRSRGREGASA